MTGGSAAVDSWAIIQGTHAGVASGAAYTDLTFGTDAGNVGDRLMNGHIGEAIIYNAALTTAQGTLVQNYLASKFNGTIGALDVYSGDTGGNGDYDYGVFGVINNGASNVTNGGLDGFGIEATLGAGAGAGQLGSAERALAGYANITNSIVALEGLDPNVQEPMTGERWDRVWYVDSAGAFQATLGFDFEDADLVATGGEYALLYSADGDFSDGWDILATTSVISGGLVQFSLADGALIDGYYTLGVNIQQVPEPATWSVLSLGIAGLTWSTRRRGRRLIAKG